MPNLSIKNVPDKVVARLRRQAARNHRSLQGELMELVCRAADESPDDETPTGNAAREPVKPSKSGTKTIEQIAAEHRDRWKEPFDQAASAVDMIRSERDAR